MDIRNSVVIITGASSGIGAAGRDGRAGGAAGTGD